MNGMLVTTTPERPKLRKHTRHTNFSNVASYFKSWQQMQLMDHSTIHTYRPATAILRRHTRRLCRGEGSPQLTAARKAPCTCKQSHPDTKTTADNAACLAPTGRSRSECKSPPLARGFRILSKCEASSPLCRSLVDRRAFLSSVTDLLYYVISLSSPSLALGNRRFPLSRSSSGSIRKSLNRLNFDRVRS